MTWRVTLRKKVGTITEGKNKRDKFAFKTTTVRGPFEESAALRKASGVYTQKVAGKEINHRPKWEPVSAVAV